MILTGDNGAANYPAPGTSSRPRSGGSNGPWRGGLSTAYEGGMRTPAMIRWPGQNPAGTVTDEIICRPRLVSDDCAPHWGREADSLRSPIDGIDQSDFILGKQERSDREYVVTYVGDTVFAVKWRNLKVHFAAFEGTHSVVQTYTFPQFFDIKEDVKESYELWGNDGYAHAWVMAPVSKILAGLASSMQQYPNIKPGQDFKGYE